MGLGKTVQSYYYAWKFLPEKPIVIVCPAHAKLVWRDELRRHFGVRVELLDHQRVSEGREMPSNSSVLVINYEVLTPPHWNDKDDAPPDSWLRYLIKIKPNLLIIDELHTLGNPMSARTRAVRMLARRTPHRVGLTGTPMSNNISSLWAPCNIIRPDLYPSYFDFCNEYSNCTIEYGERVYRGARNLPQLHAHLKKNLLVRRRKCDVLTDLPPIRREIIPIEVDLHEYRSRELQFLEWLKSEYFLIDPSAREAQKRSRMGFLRRLAAILKLDSMRRWIGDFLESGNKLLVGVCHYKISGALMKEFGKRAVLVDGTMSDTEKHAGFNKFNHDPTCELLVGNVISAGSAWSCTATSDSVLTEIPWRPSDIAQFESRTSGVGRGVAGRGSHLRIFVAEGTIEENLIDMVQMKHDWANEAIDGGAVSDFRLDELIDKMRQRHGIAVDLEK
jgi:SWI/SNF-related matrix-associated actin-dependent regulator 1 of chromatin subfamily A